MLDITIRPEELYFLGELMQAQYINYAYVAAMSDISQAYAAEKTNAIKNLGKRGLVSESLRGGIRVSNDLQKLLCPVFFSKAENTLHILNLKPEQSAEVLRFSVLNGNMTMVQMVQNQLKLTEVNETDIRDALRTKLACLVNQNHNQNLDNMAEQIIQVSSSHIGVGVRKKTYLLQNGGYYGADASGKAVRVSTDEMMEQIVSVLKEEV